MGLTATYNAAFICLFGFLGSPDIWTAKQHYLHVLFCAKLKQLQYVRNLLESCFTSWRISLAEICALGAFEV